MRLPVPLLLCLLFAFFTTGASVYSGAEDGFQAQVERLIQTGMRGQRFKDDARWIKRSAQSYSELLKLLEYSGRKKSFVIETTMLGRRSVADLIVFAKDRLLELGEIKVQLCKGQKLSLHKTRGSKSKALVGSSYSLHCDKLKEVRSWKGLKETAVDYCRDGILKELSDSRKGSRKNGAKAKRIPAARPAKLNLFCHEKTSVQAKNQWPQIFNKQIGKK